MADIVPFPCIRPAAEYTARVAALPYDVYNRREARAEAAKDSLSFLNIDRPETQFEETQDMYAPEVYRKASELLESELRDGILVREEQPFYYLYELTMNGRSQTGLVACASIDDYLNGVIKKHENTRAEKEADRIRHVDDCSAQTGPIFLAYRRNKVISQVTERVKQEKPLFDFVSADGIRHRGWCIDSREQSRRIQEAFAAIDAIYIADGHHRAASAVRVGQMRRKQHLGYTGHEQFNYFLSILFPDEELMIMDYNRVVKDLNGLDETAFLRAVEEKFRITPMTRLLQESMQADTEAGRKPQESMQADTEAGRKPQEAQQDGSGNSGSSQCANGEDPARSGLPKLAAKGEFGMYLGSRWYHLQIRPEYTSNEPVEGLDVSILQRELLEPVLGITDPRQDTRIDFVGGIRGMAELERRVHTDCAVAFAMYPTSIDELFAVADAGLLMPPKSTWFEPKLRSGLFIHEIER